MMLIQIPNDAVSVGYKEVRPYQHEQVFYSASASFTGIERDFVQAGLAYAYQQIDPHTRSCISHETRAPEAIRHATTIADECCLPQTVYRNTDSAGWWHTNALAPLLAKAEVLMTVLPSRYFC